MKKKRKPAVEHDDLKPEYDFDYSKSRPNRFASRMRGPIVTVVLEQDVAEVFDSAESVNRILRSVISALPAKKRPARKKAG